MIACLPCAAAEPESRGARLRAWARRVAAAVLRLVRRRRRRRGPWRYQAALERHAHERGFSSRTR